MLLGSNQFPNFTEVAAKKIKADAGACSSICNCKSVESRKLKVESHCGCGSSCENALPTLPVARAAEEFETLRLETEASKKQPVAFMLTIGNLAMRIARAQFSCNFLACAGYKVIDNNGFATIAEGIKAARKAKADIIVLCSSDDEYADLAPKAWKKLQGKKELFIVAGAPACMEDLQKLGITNFIHVRCNVLETLKALNAQLLKK